MRHGAVPFGDRDGVTNRVGIAPSPPNRAWGSANGPDLIDGSFPGGVLAIGGHGFDFRLEVFDAGGSLIHSVGYTDGTAGLDGGAAKLGFLGIASDTPIAHARFTRSWSNQVVFGFEIDDLRFLSDASTATHRAGWGPVKSAMRGARGTRRSPRRRPVRRGVRRTERGGQFGSRDGARRARRVEGGDFHEFLGAGSARSGAVARGVHRDGRTLVVVDVRGWVAGDGRPPGRPARAGLAGRFAPGGRWS